MSREIVHDADEISDEELDELAVFGSNSKLSKMGLADLSGQNGELMTSTLAAAVAINPSILPSVAGRCSVLYHL